MEVRRCGWSFGLATTAALFSCAPGAQAQASQEAAQRLAERYSPITMVRQQEHPLCGTAGEQYQPTSVETVLGNPTVVLERDVRGEGLETVKRAPTAADVAGLDKNYYLNLNGDPLGDTCVFARDFDRLKRQGRAPVITYAHIAREAGHPGFALQYWFFWYFNQFNDLHEGDWEGMQLTFDAATPAEALATNQEPSGVLLFQHAGGERADWNDSKVQTEGTHPVVYPAAGSHATFYDSTVYVENGGHGSGVGCDNSSSPLRELRPAPVLLPDRVTERGRFSWLSFYGHWGQKEKGFNNGPTGPQTKTQWRKPFMWMDDQRSTSARMPGGSIVGPAVTKAFCGAVATVSGIINLHARASTETLVTLLGFVALIVFFVGFTRWRPVDLEHLRARRSFGQLVRTARQLYGRHWRVLVPIGLVAIPIIGGVHIAVDELSKGSSDILLAIGDLLDYFVRPVATALVSAVGIVFVRSLVEARRAGFVDSWHGMSERFWRVVGAQLLATLGITLMFLSIIGIPFALWKLVGWAFVQQEVLFTDKSFRDAFRSSSKLVRGRWLHTLRAVLFFNLLMLVIGPMLTFALIFTPLDLIWINLLGSLIYSLLIPYVSVGYTLLYFDLEARAATDPAKPHRLWRPWRPKQFGRRVKASPPAGAQL